MNKEETLALYAQGKEAWNVWAKAVLASQKCKEPWHMWPLDDVDGPSLSERQEESKAWRNEAKADFSGHHFAIADFSGFVFPGEALFMSAHFSDAPEFYHADFRGPAIFSHTLFDCVTVFSGATFHHSLAFNNTNFIDDVFFIGDPLVCGKGALFFNNATFKKEATFSGFIFPPARAMFRKATFESQANFSEATFDGPAFFDNVTFKSRTMFYNATFKSFVQFTEAIFEGSTHFDRASFLGGAYFSAIQSKSEFTTAGSAFLSVPDFQQATFVEAPRLDNVKIESQRSRNISFTAVKSFFKGDLEKEGRWRALKRLATQGHDHASEQLFFRGELLARRGVTDKYWHASFWFSVFYQIFSDFGRSLIRPLLWWAVGVLVFAGIYLSHHPRGGEWLTLECIAGTGKPWVSALGLSLHRSLPALSGFRDTLPQFHACLYGVHSESPFRPIIPDVVSFLSVPQVLFSAVMIFLFLLAVRNHFRIR